MIKSCTGLWIPAKMQLNRSIVCICEHVDELIMAHDAQSSKLLLMLPLRTLLLVFSDEVIMAMNDSKPVKQSSSIGGAHQEYLKSFHFFFPENVGYTTC